MKSIDTFIKLLKQQKNEPTLFNPYLKPELADNLRIYLNLMNNISSKRVLLVGEAPGYKGCALTGIPFSCGRVFQEIDHPIINQLKNQIILGEIESENTASIVWKHLKTCKITPLFWNAFPFHPHPLNKPNQNRAPKTTEIREGINYLKKLQSIFKAEIIAGVGRSGVKAAKWAFPDQKIEYIRHPSFGGKTEFILGVNKILN